MVLSILWTSGSLASVVYNIGIGQTKAPLEIITQLKGGGRLIVPVRKTVSFGTHILAAKRKIEAEAGL